MEVDSKRILARLIKEMSGVEGIVIDILNQADHICAHRFTLISLRMSRFHQQDKLYQTKTDSNCTGRQVRSLVCFHQGLEW